MTKRRILSVILSVLILIGTFGIVLYYIFGNAFLTEFQSDCADTLLWAQASLESGTLFKPSFDYAYRLAFGGQWLFIPFLKLYGVGMTALRAGMGVFALLFTLVLVLFFRSIHQKWNAAFFEAALMLMAVCATKKTREIFFGHVIHYSLSVFYLLLAFVLLSAELKQKSRSGRLLMLIPLFLCLFMCSGNGTVEMLYVTLPLLAGCLIEFYLNGDKKLPAVCFCIVTAAAAGYFFSKSLNTNYADRYSVIVPAEDWAENLLIFPKQWISLFYQLPGKNLDSFSPVWIKTVFKLIAALFTLGGMLLSFFRLKFIRESGERIFIFTAWAMFAAFLFFFIFGRISDVDWRLIPLVFAAEVVTLILLRQALFTLSERTLSAGLSLLCGAMLIINAFSNGLSVLRIPYDEKIWFAENGLLETLKAHDLHDGYITSYWLSHTITLLSDNEIRPRLVSWGDDGPYLLLFNSDLEWYDDIPGNDRRFLAVSKSLYDPEMPLAKEAIETWDCFQEDTRNSIKEDYVIMVFDQNIMKSEYDRLIGRYR